MHATPRRWGRNSRRGCARRAQRKSLPRSAADAAGSAAAGCIAVTRATALAGRGIVVTRPAHQAERLAGLLREAGARPILFPVIEIADVEDPAPLNALIERLDDFDRAIFVSPNAVHKAMTLIAARRVLPGGLTYAAVGSGSVRELQKFRVTEVIAPARVDSEALLALPAMSDVAGKRMVVFRGNGGREALGEALT